MIRSFEADCLVVLDARSDEQQRRKPARVRIETETCQIFRGALVTCKPLLTVSRVP